MSSMESGRAPKKHKTFFRHEEHEERVKKILDKMEMEGKWGLLPIIKHKPPRRK